MLTVDIVAIIVAVFATLVGLGMGFGRSLKFISDGFLGKIFSIIICYFLFGVVLKLQFVQDLLNKFVIFLVEQDSTICDILLKLKIDLIVLAIVLFIIVRVISKLTVDLIKGFFEMDNNVMKIVNKLLGLALMVAFFVVLTLVVMQILFWITGANGSVFKALEGSIFGLDKLYLENPLNEIITRINTKI